MQTSDGHIPLSGPSSDPILYGVATALSQMFPLVEHPGDYGEVGGRGEGTQTGEGQDTE